MKNLKSKISILLSLSLIGAMLTVPCAQAQAETTQWKTLYGQDFRNPNMTLDDVLKSGWTVKDNDSANVSMKQFNDNGQDVKYGFQIISAKMYTTYNTALGTKYKITAVVQMTGNNMAIGLGDQTGKWFPGLALYKTSNEYTMKLESGSSSDYVAPTLNDENKRNDTSITDYVDYTVEIERDGSILKANVKNDGMLVGKELTVTDNDFAYDDGKLTFFSSDSYGGTRIKCVKIEVPKDYIEYKEKTTYSNANLTTLDGYTADGWVYGGTNSGVSMSTNSDQTNRLIVTHGAEQSAYIFYNKDLGTAYNVKDKVCSWYNDIGVWFNATLGEDNRVMSGFYIDFGNQNQDNNWILKYAIRTSKEADLDWNTLATSSWTYKHGGTVEFDLKYMNGKITITTSDNKVLTYDASNLIAEHEELASGVIGQYNSNSRQSTSQMDFSYTTYVPAAEGCKISTLIPVVSNGNVNYSVKVDNNGSKVLSGAKVIVAAYDNLNNLIGIDTDAAYSGALGQQTVSGSFAIGGGTPASYKAFLFDGLDTIKPLANCITK